MNTQEIARRLEIAAAVPPIKGTRVAVKYGPNEWYLGTVARSGAKIMVAFDDGSRESHLYLSATVKTVDYKKVRKTALTDAQVKAITLAAPKATNSGKTAVPIIRNGRKTVVYSPKPASKPAPVAKPPASDPADDEMDLLDILAKEYAAGKSIDDLVSENQEFFLRDTGTIDAGIVREIKRRAGSRKPSGPAAQRYTLPSAGSGWKGPR